MYNINEISEASGVSLVVGTRYLLVGEGYPAYEATYMGVNWKNGDGPTFLDDDGILSDNGSAIVRITAAQ